MLELASPLGVGGVLEASLRHRSRRSASAASGGTADQPVLERIAVEQDRALVAIRAGTPPGRGCRTGRPPPVAPRAGRGGRARADRARSRRPRRARARAPPRGQRTTRAPLPTGRSDEIVPVRPTEGRPASSSSAATACTYRAHPCARRAASVGGDGLPLAVALGHERDLALRASGCEPDAVLDRDGQDEPAAVVGVLADEVDAPRRPDAELRFSHCAARLTHSISGAVSGTGRRA